MFRGLLRQKPRTAKDPEIKAQRTATEERMESELAQESPRDQDLFLDLAREGYQEQDRRAERSERRATTLLGSITIILAVVGATTGILTSSEILRHAWPRWLLGGLVLFVLLCFGLAARWAMWVITVHDHLRRPSTRKMLSGRAARTEQKLYAHSVAALVDSIAWNQRIADY
jgi:hypothetical protein